MLLAMSSVRRKRLLDGLSVIVLWLLLGFSLGWYYTFTYYWRSGWPMPTVECCGTLIMYYFSVVTAATPVQAVHWMAVFPPAGVIWAALLTLTAPRFGGQNDRWSGRVRMPCPRLSWRVRQAGQERLVAFLNHGSVVCLDDSGVGDIGSDPLAALSGMTVTKQYRKQAGKHHACSGDHL